MRGSRLAWMALALLMPVLPAQLRKTQPVGLVMGAGAQVARGKAPAATVKPGEILFAGDVLKAGSASAAFLFCPEKYSAALSANGEAALTDSQVQVKSGELVGRKTVAACYLPEVQKLSVASQQHYGVMLTRGSGAAAPKGTLADRIKALPDDKHRELEAHLATAEGSDPVAVVARATALEKAGLLYDAGELYREAAQQWPEAAWLKKKIVEVEDALLKQQGR
ncbi:hypothetical protein [uncultured Paludibaculum sp.]|uniref:hypothetical protein n=1 Tax=uncultured Paludibaculum sp. TaxID=1765020 RepID=UPI002AABF991|nr:hypothetical protein [uncultured Paludibaculum sp.]